MIDEDRRKVLEATAALIRQAREILPSYARGLCASSTMEVARILQHTRCQLIERRFDSRARGMAAADYDAEGPVRLIGVDSAAPRADRWITTLHEIGHVLAGEAEEAVYMTDEDTLLLPERRADLFAIADLIPGDYLVRMRQGHGRGRRPWRAVALDVASTFRELTGWSSLRVWDRAWLRVDLFREYGI